MSYHVHRSHLVYDEGVHICLADGIDNRSPGELTETHPEEGEYEVAQEALDAARALSARTGEPIALGSGNAMGLYSSADDPSEDEALELWASRRDAVEEETGVDW